MSSYSIVEGASDTASALYYWVLSFCCSVSCTVSSISVGKRTLRVVRLLAEGGFSFVYLVEAAGEKFALKKVLCQLEEQSAAAKWEIAVHRAIKSPHCMPLIDHCVVPAPNGAEEFRLLMPLYPNGTLLDLCVKHMNAGTRVPERTALRIFHGILKGVAAFHEHDPPWAHRDIKPANVLLGEDEAPVLMDFGSVKEARVTIGSRTQALLMQEDAAQHCSMPYRAPELFDCASDAVIDERTDVFSLGATLYATAFYYSPFECTFQDNTQRIVECSHLRVIGGAQFPTSCEYSDDFIKLIVWMLTIDPQQRPTVHQVLSKVAQLLER
jgi:serine/threonine kinase 16